MNIKPEDKRYPLIQLLSVYKPADAADDARRSHVKDFVESTPDCFERTHVAGHITGSAWVVDKTGEKVLLTHHKKLGKWLQLGGHADGNPDVLATALREAEEESSLPNLKPVSNAIFDVDVHSIPARPEEPEHLHYDIRFLVRATGQEKFTVSDESNTLAWVTLGNVPNLSKEESLLRMLRKWEISRRI